MEIYEARFESDLTADAEFGISLINAGCTYTLLPTIGPLACLMYYPNYTAVIRGTLEAFTALCEKLLGTTDLSVGEELGFHEMQLVST